jgi:hypothetical protein
MEGNMKKKDVEKSKGELILEIKRLRKLLKVRQQRIRVLVNELDIFRRR